MSLPEQVAALVERLKGNPLDPHYLGFFECFNHQRYFEAHEVLEVLWLQERGRPQGLFYKGLIQLAGAFVHLQKNRPKPAAALFRLARGNLEQYPSYHLGLDVGAVLQTLDGWLLHLSQRDGSLIAFAPEQAPKLLLGHLAYCQTARAT